MFNRSVRDDYIGWTLAAIVVIIEFVSLSFTAGVFWHVLIGICLFAWIGGWFARGLYNSRKP